MPNTDYVYPFVPHECLSDAKICLKEITEVGKVHLPKSDSAKNRRPITGKALIVVLDGSGCFSDPEDYREVSEGDILLIETNHRYFFGADRQKPGFETDDGMTLLIISSK